jgi:outer membrane lipoprotein carrier protein
VLSSRFWGRAGRERNSRFSVLMRSRFCIAIVLFLGAALSAWAAEAKDVAQAVDAHYNSLRSLRSDFTEIYQAPGISRTESGVLWLKKPSRMRWEYRNPREKLFVTDSENAYFYVTGERQATKTSLKTIDDIRSPLRFLLGKTKLEKELDGLSFAPDIKPLQPGDVVLRGVPKAMRDRISEVLLEVSPVQQLTRIVITGTDGSTTDFRFAGMQENIALPNSFFRFNPPPGVPTIQEDHAAQ